MTNVLPPLTKDRIEAFAASAVLWLVRLLSILLMPGAARPRRLLRRLMLYIEHRVTCVIFLKAVIRSVPPPPRRPHPRSVPPGFRRAWGGPRLFWRSARIAKRNACFIDRVARLLEALADSEAYVVHFMKRLARGLCFSRLVACAPPAVALAAAALPPTSFADSS